MRHSTSLLLAVLAQSSICLHALSYVANDPVFLPREPSGPLNVHNLRAHLRDPNSGIHPVQLRLRGGGGKQTRVNPFNALNGLSVGLQNLIGFMFVAVLVPLEVELIGVIGRRQLVPASLARKLTHIFTGSTMFACLSLLPLGQSWPGRFSIALVMTAFIVVFSVAAYIPENEFKKMPVPLQDRIQSLVNSCSRSGKRRELAQGTLFYCILPALLLVLFGTAPVTVFALSALFIGDGVADPVGRTFGTSAAMRYELKWYKNAKSYPGSLAFFLGSLASSVVYGALFKWAGHYAGIGHHDALFLRGALASSLITTLVEALSPPDIDNLLVPMASILTSTFLSESGRIPFLLSTRG